MAGNQLQLILHWTVQNLWLLLKALSKLNNAISYHVATNHMMTCGTCGKNNNHFMFNLTRTYGTSFSVTWAWCLQWHEVTLIHVGSVKSSWTPIAYFLCYYFIWCLNNILDLKIVQVRQQAHSYQRESQISKKWSGRILARWSFPGPSAYCFWC